MAEEYFEADYSERSTKRWLMFLISPADLLALLHVVSNPRNKFAAGSLPPDVRIEDTFYDEGQNYLGMMLESDYFEPVEVESNGHMMTASWPRAVFTMQTTDEVHGPGEELWSQTEEVSGPMTELTENQFIEELKGAIERGRHLRALNFSGADLLEILRAKNVHSLRVFPSYKEDTRILGCIANQQINGWSVFLEHPDFEQAKATASEDEDMVFIEVEGDGHDLTFRFGLPGAKIERRMEIQED
jgi:hypothetical protein